MKVTCIVSAWLAVGLAGCGNQALPSEPPSSLRQFAPEDGTLSTPVAGGAPTVKAADKASSLPSNQGAYNPGVVQPGYRRYEAAPVDVPVGYSADWAQWVGGPLDQDYDVLDVTGGQSARHA